MVKFEKYGLWQPLRIIWHDSVSTSGWQTLKKIPKGICITVGHFYHQNKSTITLVLSRDKPTGADDTQVSETITIPKVAVQSVQKLVITRDD